MLGPLYVVGGQNWSHFPNLFFLFARSGETHSLLSAVASILLRMFYKGISKGCAIKDTP